MRDTTIMKLTALALLAALCAGCGESLIPGYHKRTTGAIDTYKRKLEDKLLAQYRNHPDFGARVFRVKLEASKDIKTDETGKYRKVEFAQLVFDRWGERLPELEQEYFVVVFGPPGGPRKGRSAPAIDVGLDSRGAYSEGASVSSARAVKVEDRGTGRENAGFCPVCGAAVEKAGLCASCQSRGQE